MALNLWPVPHGLEDLLNPIGVTGSNPNKVNNKCQNDENNAQTNYKSVYCKNIRILITPVVADCFQLHGPEWIILKH